MQRAAEFLAALGESIEDIKAHLATMDEFRLEELLASLPAKSAAGSAEMVMIIHICREIDGRRLDSNVLSFPAR